MPSPKFTCGAVMVRCTLCNRSVGRSYIRLGNGCPKCEGATVADTAPGTCERSVPKHGVRCRQHGGEAPQVRAVARRRLLAERAADDLTRLGISVETTPVEALEAMLWEAAGNVVVLRGMAAELAQPLIDERGPHGASKLVEHPLVVLYNQERDRLAKLSEACVKLGLDERRVKLAEAQIARLYDAVTKAAAGLPDGAAAGFRVRLAAELRSLPPVTEPA